MAEYYSNPEAMMPGSAIGGFEITPDDDNDLAIYTRAIRASGAGNIKITGVDGNTWIAAFLAGETRPIRAKRVWDEDTTATGIEGMY